VKTATGAVSRHLPAYGAALLLVLGLVLIAPGLEGTTEIVLFIIAVFGLAALPLVLAAGKRKTILLGVFAFVAPFAGVDKWFLYRLHNGGSPGIQLSIADLVMVVLYAVWLWEALSARRVAPERRMPLNGALLAGVGFVALLSFSAFGAADPELAGLELLQTAKLVLWLVYIGYNVCTVEHLRALGSGIASAVVVHSAFAVAEKVAGRSLGLGIFGEQQGVTVGLFAGAYTRAGGLIGHPVLLGAFFALTVPFLLAIVVGSKATWSRWAGAAAILVGAAALALTLSRGAIIAWAFSFGLFIAGAALRGRLRGHGRDLVSGLVAVFLVAAIAASPVIYERFLFSDPGSVSGREQLNDLALRVISAHPVTGVGLNNWPVVMAAYDTTGISLLATDPVHNLYLLLWAETGIIGLAGFVGLVAVLLVTGFRALRRSPVPEVQLAALAAVTSLLAVLIMGLASWELRLTPEHQLFWCVAGLVVAVRRMSVAGDGGSGPGTTGAVVFRD